MGGFRCEVIRSVIVNNRHVVRVGACPHEADPPLIVDANAMLAGSLAFQLFEPISRKRTQIVETLRGIDREQLTQHRALQFNRVPADSKSLKDPLGMLIGKRFDQV